MKDPPYGFPSKRKRNPTHRDLLIHMTVSKGMLLYFFLNCYKLELSGGKSNLHLFLYYTFFFFDSLSASVSLYVSHTHVGDTYLRYPHTFFEAYI